MALFDARAARIVATILLFLAAGAFVYAARRTLIVFLFAIFFAYLIDPLVERVGSWTKRSRQKAIAIVYLGMFGALALILTFVGPPLAHEAVRLGRSIPDLYGRVASGQIALQIGSQHGWSPRTQAGLQEFLASHREEVLRWAAAFGKELANVGQNTPWLLLVPILALFFLKDGRQFGDTLLEFVDRRRQKQFLSEVMGDIHLMLAHFIRAQLILAALSLTFYTAALLLLRVPYGLALGVVGGLLEFIPMVGPLVAAVLILGIALAVAYKHLLVLALILGGWRMLQDYYNSPHIMGAQVELSPLATLFGVLVGAEIAGVIGVYLSIPIMASLRILWRRWRAYESTTPRMVPTA